MNKGKRAYYTTIASLILFSVFLNMAAWRSAAFSDFYVSNIFPVITGLYGRITSLFGFSVGEVMLVILVAFIAFVVVFIAVHTAILAYEKSAGKLGPNFFKTKRVFDFISGKLYRITPLVMAVVVTVMSLNCFVLYHTTKLSVYDSQFTRRYDLQQLADLRDFIVTQCNDLSKKVPHDEFGNIIYEGNMEETAIRAMQNLSREYPRLGGYYVTPKPLYYSDFMCQQYMQGYYFPFSMEANYNDSMSIMNKPFTMCHELAHTHGYIYEDEANFFGFLACIRSDDVVFKYSGYLGVLNYINNDFYRAVSKEEYNSHVKISDRVKYDNQFVTKEAWKRVESHAVIKTETVKKAADMFIDTNLKVNGVLTGKVSYTHVVALILDYYYNEPEYAIIISGDNTL
ncbi:DUF3810 domain-containing protein [Butyrivibrio sp. X503]|uniref:DUF3810 domain-containing protein n=1 Tax=Butyrivibrio sp. X503 TaxID=2364878 RepID=UPI001313EE8D|nr:DUF3810 domain-containing protein [Butyrivibrio sp. X503]